MAKSTTKEKGSGLLDVIATILVALGVAFLLRTFVVGVYEVPSGSMLETIQEGDLLLGEKVTLNWESPKAGDVVTFESPREPGTTLVLAVRLSTCVTATSTWTASSSTSPPTPLASPATLFRTRLALRG